MEISVGHQVIEAAASIIFGVAAALLYDVFRTFRYELKLKNLTHFLDALYWIICSFSLLVLGLTVGNGQQRVIMTVIAFLGGTVYFLTVSKYCLKLFKKIAELVRELIKIMSIPVNKTEKIIKKTKKI